jgi:hypothetical protein
MASSKKIDVRIKNGGEELGVRSNSPVRKLPDGTAGVVVNGLVYRLREDHSVDLADEGTPKEECPDFFRPQEPFVYAESPENKTWWYFERARGRAYVAFDGSAAFARRLNDQFDAEGLSLGYDESFRPARDGYFYDYFIRLEPKTTEEDVRRVVNTLTEEDDPDGSAELFEEAIRLFIQNLGGPKQFLIRWTELLRSNKEMEAEVSSLRQLEAKQSRELNRIRDDLQTVKSERARLVAQKDRAEAMRDEVCKELAAIRAIAEESAETWDDLKADEIESLRERLAQSQNELEQSIQLRELAEGRIVGLESELALTQDEVDRLKLEVLEAERERTEPAPILEMKSSKKEKRLLHEFLAGAFPRLEFEETDKKVLLTKYASVEHCAKVLADLQEK